MQFIRSLRPCGLAVGCAIAFAGPLWAQSLTPQQFVDACRTNPANTVLITEQTKLQTSFQGTSFSTPTGCTVVLGEGGSLELDTITVNIGGPFTVQGGRKSKVAVVNATLNAPSIALNLTGAESEFQMGSGRMFASAGNLGLAFGEKGKMEIKQSGGWYQPSLAARRGAFSLSAGAYFNGLIEQSGLQGATGMSMQFNGRESVMSVVNSDLLVSSGATSPAPYTVGPFHVGSSAANMAFEMKNVNLMESSQTITVAMNGPEAKLGLYQVRSATGSRRIAVTAYGLKSEVKVENVLLYGIPEVVIETGAQGSTTVTNNPGTITGSQLIRIRAGLGGSCSAAAQGLSAPVLHICQ